jgi:ligand-binding sensor domain-containing protein
MPLILLAGLYLHQTVCAETTNLPEYFTRVWQTQDGLPNNAVTAIVQTHDGYLWLATYDGLARFDGVTFTVFDNSNSPEMRSSRITSLFEDAPGNLWIGCESGDLVQYRDGHFHSVPFHASWENRKIQTIGATAADEIRLLNADGKLADLDGKIVAAPSTGGTIGLIDMTQNAAGEIWIDWNGQIFALDQDLLTPLSFGQSPDDFAKGICSSRDGGLWIITQDRVLKWSKNEIGIWVRARWAKAPS